MSPLVKGGGYFDDKLWVCCTGNMNLRARTECNSQGIAISMPRSFANSQGT